MQDDNLQNSLNNSASTNSNVIPDQTFDSNFATPATPQIVIPTEDILRKVGYQEEALEGDYNEQAAISARNKLFSRSVLQLFAIGALMLLFVITAASAVVLTYKKSHNGGTSNSALLASLNGSAKKDGQLSQPDEATLTINRNTVLGPGYDFTATGDVLIQSQPNSAKAFRIQNAAGNNLLVADTLNNSVTINGTLVAGSGLNVNGDVSTSGAVISTSNSYSLSGQGLTIGGVLVCTSAGCIPNVAIPNFDTTNLAKLTANQTFTGINNFSSAGNSFVGDGSGISALNASNVSAGTLSDSRLSGNVGLLNANQTFSGNNTFSLQIQASAGINVNTGYSVGGTAGTNLTCGPSELLQQGVIQGGIITSGNCVTIAGGTTPSFQQVYDASIPASIVLSNASGVLQIQDAASPLATNLFEVTSNSGATKYFAVNNLGISVTGNVNTTGQYQIGGVQISSANLSNDANLAKLTANQTFSGNNTFSSASNSFTGNGSGLTSLNASNVSSGTLNDLRLSANVTLGGNVFNGPSQLVQNTAGGILPILSGANLTSLNASNVSSGTLNDARLSANVGLLNANQTFSGNNTFSSASNSFTGSGVGLTSLNGSNISSGTVNDARLSSNVALKNGNNIFTGNDSFQLGTAALTVQDASSPLVGNLFEVTDNAGTTKYFSVSSTGAKVNGNDVCTTSGNCVGTGGGGSIGGSGTAGTIAIFTGSGFTIGDSVVTQSGGTVTVGGGLSLGTGNYNFNASNSSGTFQTSTGANTLNGNTTVAGTNTFTVAGGLTSLGANLDVNSSVAYKHGTDISTTGSLNDFNYGNASLIRLTGASTQTITGLLNSGGNRDGMLLTIINSAGQNAILTDNDATSTTASNRIRTGTGGSVSIATNSSTTLVYDSQALRWRVIGDVAGGAGAGVTTVGTFTSCTSYANGAQISANTISFSCADITNPGMVSTGAQTWAGAKSFNGLLTGNAGLTVTGGAVSLNANSNNAVNIGTGTNNQQVSIGGGAGTFALDTTNIDISNTGAITGATGITLASGNFLQNGAGTFGTGSGAVSLNGNTSVTGSNTFNVGTGTSTFAGGNISQTGSGTFSTGTGIVSLNGATTVASNKAFTANGSATFTDATNSATAFQIQNAAGVNILNVDTSANVITTTQSNLIVTDLSTPTSPNVAFASNSSGNISGAAGITYYYKVTALNAVGESLASSEVNISTASFTQISTPSAPTATNTNIPDFGPVCGAGAAGCVYKITYITANGETVASAASNTINNTNSKIINLSFTACNTIPGCTGINVYRNHNNTSYQLLTGTGCNGLAPSSTSCADDTNTDSGITVPSAFATTNLNTLTVSWTAVTNATSYRIYRGTSSNGESVYQTSASSPFADSSASGGTAGSVPTRSTVAQIGVGTSTPTANLDVRGTALFKNATNSTTAFQIQNASGTAIFNVDATTGNVGIGTANPLKSLQVASTFQVDTAHGIWVNNEINGGLAASPGALYIQYTSTANTLINSNGGNVGIGTTTPNYNLQLNNPASLTRVAAQFTNGATGSTATDGLVVGVDSDNNNIIWGYDANQLKIATSNTERVRIDNNGNVGIGTTTPNALLSLGSAVQTNKLYLYDLNGNTDKYGLGIASSTLQIFAGTTGQQIAFGKYDGTTFSEYGRWNNGNLGIGNSGASGLLSVGASSQFQVSSGGAVTAVGVNSGSGQIQGTGGINVSGAVTLAATAGNTASIGNSTGALTLAGSNSSSINIGTGTITAGTYNGDTLTSTALTFSGSNPVISVAGGGSGLTLQANGAGTLLLNNTGAGTVNLGTANTTTIGIGSASSTATILGITNINNSGSAATNIGTGSYLGTINIGNNTVASGGFITMTPGLAPGGGISIGLPICSSLANSTCTGRSITLTAGDGGNDSLSAGDNGGSINLNPGFGTANDGNINLNGLVSTSITSNIGAPLNIQPGQTSTASSTGAALTLQAGNDAGATSSTGGTLTLKGGDGIGIGTKTGGNVVIQGGAGTTAGLVQIGTANTSTTTLGASGATTTIAGSNSSSITFGTNFTVNTSGAVTTASTINTDTLGASALTFSGASPTITNTGTGTVTLQAAATGTLVLNTAGAGTVNLGTTNTTTIGVGNTSASTITNIKGGTASTLGAEAIQLQVASTGAIGIATNSVAQTVNIGNTTGASGISALVGSGGFIIDGSGASSTFNVGQSFTSSTISLGGISETGTMTLGYSTVDNEIDIGNNNTANNKTQTIKIGAGTGVGTGKSVLTIGSTANASSLTLQAGSAGISLNGATTVAGSNTFNVGTGTSTFAGGNISQTGSGTFSTGTGTVSLNGDTTIASGKQLQLAGGASNILATGSATATTATTSGTGTNTTTLTFTGTTSFANNDVVFIDNAGQDFYTRIVSGANAASVTVSPAVSFDNAATVTKYNVQNIGATTTDYTTLNNRFFQGYFLGGVVTGAGSTTLSDQRLSSSGALNIQSGAAIGITTGSSNTALTLNSGSSGNIQFFSSSNTITSAGALTLASTITANTTNTINGISINTGSISGVTGLTMASGNFDTSASSGTFKTSTGANTLGGAVTINDATTPSLTTAAGKTNTGYLLVNGKTSGGLKLTSADAAAQTVTISLAAQTTGASTLTIPDQGGTSRSFVFDTLTQTLSNKTLTAPVINGATSSGSTAIDFSGNSGAFKTTTGAVTIGSGAITISGNITSSGAVSFDYSGSNSTFKTSTGLTTVGGNLTVNGATVTLAANSTINPNSSGTLGIGTSNVSALTVGSTSTDLNLTSGSGGTTLTSTNVSGNGTASAFVFTDGSLGTTGGLVYLNPTGVTDMTTGFLLKSNSITYNHTAAETGNLVNLAFTDGTTNAFTTTTNGILLSPTINAASGSATRTTNGLSINPTLTSCGAGTCTINGVTINPTLTSCTVSCTLNGINIATLTDIANDTSSALKLGSGWDTLISGTTATSYLLKFTNFNVTNGGTITGGGLAVNGAINLNNSGTGITNIGTGSTAGNIIIGSTSGTQTITIGDSTTNAGSGSLSLNSGSGISLNTANLTASLLGGGSIYLSAGGGSLQGDIGGNVGIDGGSGLYQALNNFGGDGAVCLGFTSSNCIGPNQQGTGTGPVATGNAYVYVGNSSHGVTAYFSADSGNHHGVCKSGGAGATGLLLLEACSANPVSDYAELYPTETTVHQGDLVMPNGSYVSSKDGKYQLPVLSDTQTSYDSGQMGVISEQTLAANGDQNSLTGANVNDSDNPQALALNGRVMTKVDTENGNIAPGDYITASSTPGVGMKATHAGEVVGRALASYNGTGVSQILVFIHPSYYNPDNNLQGDNGTFDVVTANSIVVNTLTVNGRATFNGSIVVNGHIIGNPDTSGIVTVSAGTSSLTHTFTSSFDSVPNVVITPESDTGGLRYWVAKTANDFTIHLSGPAPADIKFDYFVQQ